MGEFEAHCSRLSRDELWQLIQGLKSSYNWYRYDPNAQLHAGPFLGEIIQEQGQKIVAAERMYERKF